MTLALTPTNMRPEEMVPDHSNPGHDPRYWCLPPVRDVPREGSRSRYPMYLVTQGRCVGIWHSWTIVKAMVSGYPSAAQRGHRTMDACIAEWQEHCTLGVHPHPPVPPRTEPTPTAPEPAMPDLRSLSLADCMNNGEGIDDSLSSPSSPSSLTSTTWDEVPGLAKYFAVWGGRIVYTDREEARGAFLKEEAAGRKPRILATTNYNEAQAFSESVYWL
ncbi:hypothetical protein B0H14DRAFT_2624116 [Mycena olivaceomarginata]|nr:hypothetical protein B0H14DRAFT_2624116 [Mycena olivaceomarginata]